MNKIFADSVQRSPMSGDGIALYGNCDHLTMGIGIGLVVGGTGSGKTQFLIDLLHRGMLMEGGPKWAKVIILSPTAKLQRVYSAFPERDVHTEPEEFGEVLDFIFQHQKAQEVHQPICVILDDVVGTMRGKRDELFIDKFTQLVTGGRHLQIFVLVLTQYIKDRVFASTTVRGNLNFIAAPNIDGANREEFLKLMGIKGDGGDRIVDTAWQENYRFVVVDKSPNSKNPTKRISFVKINPALTPRLSIRYRD